MCGIRRYLVRSSKSFAMASSASSETLSLPSLQTYLGELGVPIPLPTFPSSDPINNPNDVYRSYIAAELEQLIGCDRVLLYDSLQRTSTSSKGDLVLVVPRLRLKGVKPNELAAELSSKVDELPTVYSGFPFSGMLTHKYVPSFRFTHYSTLHCLRTAISSSFTRPKPSLA